MDLINRIFLICLIIVSIVLIVMTVLNEVYEQEWQDSSLKKIILLQSENQNKGFEVVNNLASNLFQPYVVVGILLIMFCFSKQNRLDFLNFIIFFSFSSYLCALLKLGFGKGRPFWMNVEIKNLEWICYADFGYPSGHTMLPLLILEFMNKIIWKKYFYLDAKLKIFISFLFLALYSLVFFSRIFLGQHTFVQAFYGMIWGLEVLLIYRFFLEEKINFYLEHLIQKNINQQKLKDAIFIGLQFTISFVIPIILFETAEGNTINQNFWLQQIQQKCHSAPAPEKTFQFKGVSDCSIGVIPSTIFLCVLTSQYLLYIKGEYKLILDKIPRIFIRIALLLTSCVPLSLILIKTNQVYLIFFLHIIAFVLTLFLLLNFTVYLIVKQKFFQFYVADPPKQENTERPLSIKNNPKPNEFHLSLNSKQSSSIEIQNQLKLSLNDSQ